MATEIHKSIMWNGGTGTPEKYRYNLDVTMEVVDVVNNVATIRVYGTTGVQNNPTNSTNTFKASDFATLGIGAMNLASENQFVSGTEYYESSIPIIPSGDQSKADKILVQFRGDTWRYDPTNNHNKSSIYIKGTGLALNAYDGSVYQSFNIDVTFQITVPDVGDVPILTWTTSGASSATSTLWLVEETWASWFDLRWDAAIYYDANGGTGAPASQVETVTGQSKVLTVSNTIPTWTWHRFDGWATSSSASTPQYHGGDSITLTRSNPNVTLYAVWTEYYRPGAVETSDGWKSHQRNGGACNVRENGTWVEKRTIDGGTATNDPPQIKESGTWKNMHRIGSES